MVQNEKLVQFYYLQYKECAARLKKKNKMCIRDSACGTGELV